MIQVSARYYLWSILNWVILESIEWDEVINAIIKCKSKIVIVDGIMVLDGILGIYKQFPNIPFETEKFKTD